jgi:hypothetical protein
MAATIGPDDIDIYDSPRPALLREISGLEPVRKGSHVLLGGVQSTQRLALGDVGGSIWIALWPAELKTQAEYLYGQRLARPMLGAATSNGWIVGAAPQLAFRSSAASLRLYMAPQVDASEYARRWEEGDLEWIGAHSRSALKRTVWPWLKSRGYVTNDDDGVFAQWLDECLGRRPAFLRAGLRLKRKCGSDDSPAALRREVDAILAAAGEPALPARALR